MKFVEYKGDIPSVIKKYDNRAVLKGKLYEFYNMNIKVAKIDLDDREYSDLKSANLSIARGIKRWGLPLTVHKIGDELFIVNREL